MKIKFVTWDWKEQINIDALNIALSGVFNGRNAPRVVPVSSTGDDSLVAVISGETMNSVQAQAIFNHYGPYATCSLPDEENPYNHVLDIKQPD